VRGDLRGMVDSLHALMIGVEPDLTLIIDVNPATGLARAKGRQGAEERFEDFGETLQEKVRAGFLELAREFPGRCRLIDGTGTEAEVAARIDAALAAHVA